MADHLTVPIQKLDAERRLFGGWAYVAKSRDGTQVVDHSGDVVDTPEAWAALTDSFIEYALESRSGDLDHAEWGAADLVEMAIFDAEKRSALGIPEGTLPDGVYVSFKARTSPAGRRLWQQVKEGTIRSLSIVGDGWREALEGEEEDDAETVV